VNNAESCGLSNFSIAYVSQTCIFSFMQEAETDVIQEFLRVARVLGKARDPRRRIAASQWEIFFEQKLAQAEGESKETAQPAEVQ